ncbi:uncharacterized protein F4812DRAFT_454463 [Daldinia caldariorum]|uniref:uncharacterized protein n=1 Tax=Daldinia caldariorum TaxID=326644 RepID=UPI002008823B|nr:uncharacterized protein F4812DRAFT_454463 [Daldinia caldariorum]KAI1472648.1 hypothetical protein F4812DRAFT_454463 [Daldinia caldariorum]
MADARALLRAHRAENRIKHPHAAYSDAGKLLCKLCHEPVKTEALWESHVRSPNHRKRAQAQQSDLSSQPQGASPTDGPNSKRKHDDIDESMSDADGDAEEAIRKKRSKPDLALSTSSVPGGEKRQSPSELSRWTSSHTPVHGVEIAIPSRPATPAAGSNSATSTPNGPPVGRSPLIGSETTSTSTPTSTPANLPISTQPLSVPSTTTTTTTTTTITNTTITTAAAAAATSQQPQPSNGTVDEDEWAAFEAEISAEPAPAPLPTFGLQSYSADATISAAAMTAAQVAARSREEENERRKHLVDAQIADEREDATRALEAEFEEMEELEGRVRRLKERREQLRKGSGGGGIATNLHGSTTAVAVANDDVVMAKSPAVGKENSNTSMLEEGDDEDEDDDDDDEDDDWDAFRLR